MVMLASHFIIDSFIVSVLRLSGVNCNFINFESLCLNCNRFSRIFLERCLRNKIYFVLQYLRSYGHLLFSLDLRGRLLNIYALQMMYLWIRAGLVLLHVIRARGTSS